MNAFATSCCRFMLNIKHKDRFSNSNMGTFFVSQRKSLSSVYVLYIPFYGSRSPMSRHLLFSLYKHIIYGIYRMQDTSESDSQAWQRSCPWRRLLDAYSAAERWWRWWCITELWFPRPIYNCDRSMHQSHMKFMHIRKFHLLKTFKNHVNSNY